VIDKKTWKPFQVNDIFEVLNGKGITKQEISDHQGELPAVQSGEKNNGVIGYIDQEYCEQMKYTYSTQACLTVARTGSAGYVTFQPNGCCVGDSAKILKPRIMINTEVFLFFRTLLMANKYRYTYARKVTEDNYKNEVIQIPSTLDGKPDYEMIEHYMKTLHSDVSDIPDCFLEEGYEKACWYLDHVNQSRFEKSYAGRVSDEKIDLFDREWLEFHLYDLFAIDSGNKFDRSKMTQFLPTVNFVGRSSENNGVTACVDEIEDVIPYEAGLMTVALGGEYLGSCFVQDAPFYTSQNVAILKPLNQMSIYSKFFIAHLIRYESSNNYKAFARELNAHIKTNFVIRLPVTDGQEPDYGFMDRYIKSLSFSCRLEDIN
jgi:restriction endonuclease S subunit